MARKTIYIKPEKENLYERAVKYSGQKSLSAFFEKTVEDIIEKNEKDFRKSLLIVALEYSPPPSIIGELIGLAEKLLSKELLDEAAHALEIFEFKGLLEGGTWKGPKAGRDDDFIWSRAEEDDDSWLEEMYSIAISPEFKEMEKEYNNFLAILDGPIDILLKEDLTKYGLDKGKIMKDISNLKDNTEKITYLLNILLPLKPSNERGVKNDK